LKFPVLPRVADVDRKTLARDIWQTGLDETSEKSPIAVARFLRELVPDENARRVTVAADDVQDVDVARALIRQDWTEWDMRLVLTVPHDLARALQATDNNRVHVHVVGDCSTDELDCLLRRNGRSWADLPSDLKKRSTTAFRYHSANKNVVMQAVS